MCLHDSYGLYLILHLFQILFTEILLFLNVVINYVLHLWRDIDHDCFLESDLQHQLLIDRCGL
jgi:hypothetical protein